MKLCMMTYSMARQGFGPEDFVKTAADLKMQGIDWITNYGRNPKDLRQMSHDAGLEIACYTFLAQKLLAGDADWLDEIKQSVEDAMELTAPIVMIPAKTNDKIPRSEFRHFWINAFSEIIKLTDDAGLILTTENYPGKHAAFIIADDFLEAKKYIPQLKLTYDNGNAAAGEDPVISFQKCVADVVHVHLKDWHIFDTPSPGCVEMLNGKFFSPAMIGEGDIDTIACWNALKEAGYDGFINIEYEGDDYPADKAIGKIISYLEHIR